MRPLKGAITCDETWVYHYDPSSKRQSMQWNHKMSPVKKNPRLFLSKDKIIITVFWDQDGLIFMDMLEKNTSINKERNCKSLLKLKRPGIKEFQIKFHQDNARPHTAQKTLAQISRYGWTLMSHPAYSPELAPSLRGRTFENDEMLLHEVRGWFRKKEVEFYQRAFVSWKERWTKCVQREAMSKIKDDKRQSKSLGKMKSMVLGLNPERTSQEC
ncbi:hypothetical protein LAZ67_21002058 [Cordylochernes scorpioides]|uniref:Transposase n=1 Tax=Cordylochernes scorpioides TaxID=51811 RepID=A0ABY6LQ46_9ARAC|nr:hypothetical protein LAZ67_21002058 [Cordylochernes scorpioides]